MELGQVGTKVRRNRKTGRLVRGARVYGGEGTFAARIINSIRKDKGEPLLWGADMAKAVRKFIGARLRATGFIKSGWIWAIKDIARKVGVKDKRVNIKAPRVSAKSNRIGKGIAARGRVPKPLALIENSALQDKPRGDAIAVAEKGLRIGMRITIADMRRHIQKRMSGSLKKFNA